MECKPQRHGRGLGKIQQPVSLDEGPRSTQEAAATEDAAPAEVDANGDATETEAAQAMDTAEGGAPAEDNAEKENDENVDTIMEEPSAADDGSRPSGHRLFVGCIPTKLTEDELKKHFDEVGCSQIPCFCKQLPTLRKGTWQLPNLYVISYPIKTCSLQEHFSTRRSYINHPQQ